LERLANNFERNDYSKGLIYCLFTMNVDKGWL
jgi:hypothetical protein